MLGNSNTEQSIETVEQVKKAVAEVLKIDQSEIEA